MQTFDFQFSVDEMYQLDCLNEHFRTKLNPDNVYEKNSF